MFEQPVANPQKTFTDAANLAPPGFGQSFLNGLVSSYITPNAAIEDVSHAISKTPGEGYAQSALDYFNAQQNISGSSTAGNITGSTLGFFLNPETGILASGAVKGTAKLFASEALPRLGSAATASLASGAGFAGSMLPYEVPDNYNANDGGINWGGVGKSLGVFAGIGMALPALPFTAGIAAGKIKAWRAANAVTPAAEAAAEAPASGVAQADLAAAKEAGVITPEEHDLMTALNNKEAVDPALVKTVADANSVNLTPSGHVEIPLATPEDLQNIQKTAPDELGAVTSDTPPEQISPMSDHILNNRLNDIAQDPTTIDGMQGFSDHVDRIMANKDAYLDSIDNAMDTTAGIDREHPLSQDSLFNAAQEESIARENLPSEVQSALAHEDKIDTARGTVARRTEQLNREGLSDADIATRQARLDDATANLSQLEGTRPQLLSPEEELATLRKRLLNGDNLNSVDKLADKQRLDDLAHVSTGARNLRDRVDLEEQYQKQSALSTVAKAVVQKASTGIDMKASSQKVMDYLKNRTLEKVKNFTERTPSSVPRDVTFESLEKEASTPETKRAIQAAKAKADAIDREQNILTNAINCAMGMGK